MILVDTSVLIDFLKGRETGKTMKFDYILGNEIPYGISNLIYQEVLQGARTEQEYDSLNLYLRSQKFYELKFGTQSYESAARMFFLCRNKGITVRSTIDLLIAETAIENELYLLHDDMDFTNLAVIISELREY